MSYEMGVAYDSSLRRIRYEICQRFLPTANFTILKARKNHKVQIRLFLNGNIFKNSENFYLTTTANRFLSAKWQFLENRHVPFMKYFKSFNSLVCILISILLNKNCFDESKSDTIRVRKMIFSQSARAKRDQ